MKLKFFIKHVLPGLQAEAKGDLPALKQKIGAFLKQGEEEEIPVVNEDGEPVEVEQIILVGAPSEGDGGEEPPADEAPPEEMARTIEAAVTKAVNAAVKTQKTKVISQPAGPINKMDAIPAVAKKWSGGRMTCFKGKDGDYRAYGFASFLNWKLTGNKKSQDWLVRNGMMTKDMSGESNIAGGSFIPDEFLPELIRLVEEFGVFRRNVRVVPMTRDTLTIPRRTSGLTGTWLGQGTAITASDLGTNDVSLTAKKLATLTQISSELMEDSAIPIGDLIGTEIAQIFASEEDEAGYNGDGTSTNGGIHGATVRINDGNHAGGIVTAVTGNTAFGTLDLADFHSMTGKLPRYAVGGAKWYISAAGFSASMERLAHAQGGVTRVETEQGSELRFLGYPVEIVQKMNSTLTAQINTIVMLFGDLTLSSVFGDRRSMEIATSTDYLFNTDQVAIRGIERLDIVNHDLGDASTAGPLIAMKTPAS